MKGLSDSGPNFQTLFESAPGLYLVLSPDLKIVAASNAYVSATMTKRKDILGKNIFEIFPDNPDDPHATGVGNLRASLMRVLQTEAPDAMAVQKYDIRKPDGGFEERYWSPLNSPVFDRNKDVAYIIHKVEDVTEFVRLKQKGSEQNKITEELKARTEQMEAEIFKRAQQLQVANEKLREAEQVKNDFFANISHEFRTPLSLILGPVESLMSGKYGAVSDEQKRFYSTIYNNVVRLLQMVNSLLDFSKIEAGKMKVHREPTDIALLTRGILNEFESIAGKKKLDLESKIKVQEQYVMIDRYLFERIMFNLLSNAVKFTPDGGKITANLITMSNKLYLSVEDTGIGIPESALGSLFQKFTQVESSSIRRFEGTGLGLAMVKEFAGLLGGTVSVSSREGHGSKFTIECMAAPTEAPADKTEKPVTSSYVLPRYDIAHANTQKTHSYGELNLLKVLVCEDNPELSDYIVSLVQDFCQVKAAKDGEEALEVVKTWQPHLVLTDVMMPKKDGIALCTTIKNDPLASGTVVVLLTALTHREALLKGWEAKADEYLFKPFHPEELITRIRSLLSSVKQRQEYFSVIEGKTRQLEQINADLESFSYSVSHDLRAPLRSIDGYAQIMKEDYENLLDAAGKRVIEIIIANARKMGQLIDDLLAFSRLGPKKPEYASIDMNAVVETVITDMLQGAENKVRNIQRSALHPTQGDAKMMMQVWTNLLSNALKYSRQRETQVIEIGCYQENGSNVYYVRDNGVGFDMQYKSKLFGVFQRLHKADEFEGTGVGLAIVHKIITKHGGAVWAEAKVGEGATFYFSLPN
ncbi:MAG: ATP-binding protein [Bacteroidota bacterium]